MNFRRSILVLLLCYLSAGSFAQHLVSGKVEDSVTGKPLAFVNIVVNSGVNGTTTDIDGKFSIKSTYQIHQLKISYVGYQSKVVKIDPESPTVSIVLVRREIELKGVEIFPGENPANRIIRKVMANRGLNDPEKIPSFKYNTYSKVTAEYYLDRTKYTINSDPDSKLKNDSTFLRLSRQAEQQYIMILESNSQRIFLNGKSQETVLASRVSGFSNPNFSSLATDVQPFSFYKDFITLTITDVKDYLNPIAEGSIGRYDFQIEDTIYENADSVFVISYKPAKGKVFDALKGVLYINSHFYALQDVIAEPAEAGLWSIKIQQMYTFADNRYWFPAQLNYDWVLPNYPSEKVGLILRGRSYISDVDFNAPVKPGDFGPGNIIYQKGAGLHDSVYWQQNRKELLTSKEITTYKKVDSLGKKDNFDYYSKAVEKIVDGYLPISIFDFDLQYLFKINNVEGIRVGLGLRTNEKVLRWASFGGFVGYGIWDKNTKWKYGGNAEFTLSKKHEIKFNFSYSKDLEMPGSSDLYRTNYWFGYIEDKIDFNEKYLLQFRFRTLRYLQVSLSATKENRIPEYNYYYLPAPGDTFAGNAYHFAEVKLGLRYAYREKLVDAFNQRYSMGTNYPILYFTYIHGFSGVLGGQFNYDKAELGIEKSFLIKHIGKLNLYGETGFISGSLPCSKLFKGQGSFSNSFVFYFKNTFQTMRIDEFLFDRYAMFFVSHNFGANLFRSKHFRPELSLCHAMLWGQLSNPQYQTGIDFKVPDKWYFESGLILDNIVRIKLLNLVYLKVGIGGFYRYGYYAFTGPHDTPLDNVAVKLSIKISGSR